MSKPTDKPQWVRVAEQFEQSGLTQKQFAQQRQLQLSTLQSWIYRRRRQESAAPPAPMRLLPVEVTAPPAVQARSVEILMPGGVRVSFEAGTDVEYVARLVKAVGESAC
jgi:transposase